MLLCLVILCNSKTQQHRGKLRKFHHFERYKILRSTTYKITINVQVPKNAELRFAGQNYCGFGMLLHDKQQSMRKNLSNGSRTMGDCGGLASWYLNLFLLRDFCALFPELLSPRVRIAKKACTRRGSFRYSPLSLLIGRKIVEKIERRIGIFCQHRHHTASSVQDP